MGDTVKVHLLVEAAMEPIPTSLKVITEYGDYLQIVSASGYPLAQGRNCLLEGTEQDLCAWLRPFERVYVGDGHPMLQHLEPAHIRRQL